tara:strand:- start:274 stop:426 length:153 start_codon:yes stop_codon:yes gene_type:complete
METFIKFAIVKTKNEINMTPEIKTNLRRVEKKRLNEIRIRLFTLKERAPH